MNPYYLHRHIPYMTWRLQTLQMLYANTRPSSLGLDFRHPRWIPPRSHKENAAQRRGFKNSARVPVSPFDNESRDGGNSQPGKQSSENSTVVSEDEHGTMDSPKGKNAATMESSEWKRKKWNPYSESTREDLRSLMSSLRDLTQKSLEAAKNEQSSEVPFQHYRRLSETLPESPLLRRLRKEQSRLHKRQPEKLELRRLSKNPWAKMLASPVRNCQATGARLPRDLLVPWRLMRNPKDGEVYLMPSELASLDDLKLYSRKSLRISEADETVDHPKDSDIHSETTLSSHPSQNLPADGQRLYLLPFSSLLRHLTFQFITRGSQERAVPRTINGTVARLFSIRWKKAFAEGSHVNPLVSQSISKTQAMNDGERGPDPAPFEAMPSGLNKDHVKWQFDIDARVLAIMRERVLTALEGFVQQNDNLRATYQRMAFAMALPKVSTPNDFSNNNQAMDTAKSSPSSNLSSSTACTMRDESFEQRFGGSIFLYVRGRRSPTASPSSSPQDSDYSTILLNPLLPSSLQAGQPILFNPKLHPPLYFCPARTPSTKAKFVETSTTHNSHIPPLVTMDSSSTNSTTTSNSPAIQLPLFSIPHLLGLSSAEESRFFTLVDCCPLFQQRTFTPDWPSPHPALGESKKEMLLEPKAAQDGVEKRDQTEAEPDHEGEDNSEDENGIEATDEASNEGDYLILLRSTAPGGMEVIEEIWRLWRFLGGFGEVKQSVR